MFLLKKETWYRYRVGTAATLFVLLAFLLHKWKPTLLYTPQGTFRPFGVGYRHKTIAPVWFVFMILALCCYMLFCTCQ